MNIIKIVFEIIIQISQQCESVLRAGACGDDKATRFHVDKIRQLRANLNRINENQKMDFDTMPLELRNNIGKHLENIRNSEQFITAWCSRFENIQSHEQLIETDEGAEILIDQLIPPTWSWDEDLAIFNRSANPTLLRKLINRGQKRILIFSSFEIDDYSLAIQCVRLSSKNDVNEYYKNFRKNLSKRWKVIDVNRHTEATGNSLGENKVNGLLEYFFAVWRNELEFIASPKEKSIKMMMRLLKNMPYITAANTEYLGMNLNRKPIIFISAESIPECNILIIKNLAGKVLILSTYESGYFLINAGVVPDIVILPEYSSQGKVLDYLYLDKIDALLVSSDNENILYAKFSHKILNYNSAEIIDTLAGGVFLIRGLKLASNFVAINGLKFGLSLNCDSLIFYGEELSDVYAESIFKKELRNLLALNMSKVSPTHLINFIDGFKNLEGFLNIDFPKLLEFASSENLFTADFSGLIASALVVADSSERKSLLRSNSNLYKKYLEDIYRLAEQCRKISVKVEKCILPYSALIEKESILIEYIDKIFFIKALCGDEISDVLEMRTQRNDIHSALKSSVIFYDLVREVVPIFYPIVRKNMNLLS
ncbi:MAG: hypothetical protein EBZ95_10400 [Chitinophagia bacterium]|nr:hypothetical protein [Chitinophagia bacterium]